MRRSPEQNLLVAVVLRALADYMGRSVSPADRRDARRWLFSPRRGRFSLWFCCQALAEGNTPEEMLAAIQHFAEHGTWVAKTVLYQVER